MDNINLTEFSHGGGCGCKIAPQVLEQIIRSSETIIDPKLLVGNNTNDDAAVYEMENGSCVISTTDFFMPVVNDPFDFGCIAAANAISDVYAMGGTPLMAIAVLGWPVKKIPAEVAKKVLEGARSICTEAGIAIAGGHSIDSPEPFFGLAVTGSVSKENLKANNTAEDGDQIFLTKPLGIGMMTTAMKRKLLTEDDYTLLLKWIKKLNKVGAELGKIKGVHAMTDVTGFGLMGHLIEMSEGSGLSAEIEYKKVPKMAPLDKYFELKTIPDATSRNWSSYPDKITFAEGVDVAKAYNILPDPQTNGGLLIAVDPSAVDEVTAILERDGVESLAPIGVFTRKQEKTIIVK